MDSFQGKGYLFKSIITFSLKNWSRDTKPRVAKALLAKTRIKKCVIRQNARFIFS